MPILFADLPRGPALRVQRADAVAIDHQRTPPADPALLTGLLQTGHHALAETHTFLLSDGRQDAQHSILEDPAAVKVLLGEAAVADAILQQALQVVERFEHAFTAEAVQAPEQHQIELPLAGVGKHALELLAVAMLAGGAVHVLADDLPLLGGSELPQLRQLVPGVLPGMLLA